MKLDAVYKYKVAVPVETDTIIKQRIYKAEELLKDLDDLDN